MLESKYNNINLVYMWLQYFLTSFLETSDSSTESSSEKYFSENRAGNGAKFRFW